MTTETTATIRAIRQQLNVRRLSPRRLFQVDDGAYTWIGDRADLTADLARKLAFADRDGRRPDLVTEAERRAADKAWGGDWYSRACAQITCVASTCGSGHDFGGLPESWQDGSALGPIAPL
jgi:hypothetical protein